MKIIITESRLKELILKKLSQDLSNAEIIPYEDSIWIIDREKKYWYLEYEKSGTLWWRYDFFNNFFHLFSMKTDEYEPILSEWVEDVLNRKINATFSIENRKKTQVEDVLNYKVSSIYDFAGKREISVDKVLFNRNP